MSKLDSDFILNGEAFFALACYFKKSDMADQVTVRGYRIVGKIYTNKQLEKFSTICVDNES
jgi:DNA integrity scanning protein DisA with diadenylate cyclase activity